MKPAPGIANYMSEQTSIGIRLAIIIYSLPRATCANNDCVCATANSDGISGTSSSNVARKSIEGKLFLTSSQSIHYLDGFCT